MFWYVPPRLLLKSLPLAGETRVPPLYTGDIEADIRGMTATLAVADGGKLSYPSKMDTPAIG